MQLEKAKSPETTGTQQSCPPHHWFIDQYNVGRCINPGCGAVRDFGALLERTSVKMGELGELHTWGPGRGRPRKEVEDEA